MPRRTGPAAVLPSRDDPASPQRSRSASPALRTPSDRGLNESLGVDTVTTSRQKAATSGPVPQNWLRGASGGPNNPEARAYAALLGAKPDRRAIIAWLRSLDMKVRSHRLALDPLVHLTRLAAHKRCRDMPSTGCSRYLLRAMRSAMMRAWDAPRHMSNSYCHSDHVM